MISLIEKYLMRNGYQSVPELDQNQLFKAFYGYYNFSNTIIWTDGKAESFIRDGYQGNASVYSIVRKIQEKDSEPPLQAFKSGSSKAKFKSLKFSGTESGTAQSQLFRKKEMELVEEGALADLLKNPNCFQTGSEFRKEVSMWFRLCGEVFIYGVRVGGADYQTNQLRDAKKFMELYCLPVDQVELVQGDMFKPVKGYKFRTGDQMVFIPASEVLHLKMTNPVWNLQGTQLRGQSPLLAGIKYLQKNNEAVSSLYRSLQNEGAKGFISPYPVTDPEKWLTREQLLTLKDSIQKRWEGSANKNKVGTAGLPMQYQQIALSPVALDIIRGLEYDDKKLCNLWGVNPAIFDPDTKYENLEQAKKQMVVDVCIPFLHQFEQGLNDFLIPAFDGEADYIDFDTFAYSELQADAKLIMETYWKGGLATLNECRTMLGWDEIDEAWAKTIWTESSRITMEEAFANPDFKDLM